MSTPEERSVAVVVRVGTPGRPFFQLRKGEMGISVFDPAAVDPPLSETEILEPFRAGSIVVYVSIEQITHTGLDLAITPGADVLPDRLQAAHREIVPGTSMDRTAFKMALRLLE